MLSKEWAELLDRYYEWGTVIGLYKLRVGEPCQHQEFWLGAGSIDEWTNNDNNASWHPVHDFETGRLDGISVERCQADFETYY